MELALFFFGLVFGFIVGGFGFGEDIHEWRERRRKWKRFVDDLNEEDLNKL